MTVLLGIFVMSLFGYTPIAALAQTIPDHTKFTADRFKCESKELDYKFTEGRQPGTQEGIMIWERPLLNVSIIALYKSHPHGKEILSLYINNDKGKVSKVDGNDKESMMEYDRFRDTYYPVDFRLKINFVFQECKKRKAD